MTKNITYKLVSLDSGGPDLLTFFILEPFPSEYMALDCSTLQYILI